MMMERTSRMKHLLTSYGRTIIEMAHHRDDRDVHADNALRQMLEDLACAWDRPIQITVVPKQTDAGHPDFRVWDGAYQVIGYIVTTAPGTPRDHEADDAHLRHYRRTFPNLIVTDGDTFRLYRHGVERTCARITHPGHAEPSAEQIQHLAELFEEFLSWTLPSLVTAEDLARALARRTRFLRDVIRSDLAQGRGPVHEFYAAFQHTLIADLTEEQFADLFAQTITYSLFAARTRTQGPFNRTAASGLIRSTVDILREVVRFIAQGAPSPQMEVILDDIAAVLHAADMQAIRGQDTRQGMGHTLILHFYETFLADYDPETRKRCGVYYTPQPVVRYMVRAVHTLLKTRFGRADGLADPCVTLLDPAAGTLTFLAEAVRLAVQECTNTYGADANETLLRTHILPHFFAYEVLMAPSVIGQMAIGFLLESLGLPLRDGERFQVFLTNALDPESLRQTRISGLASCGDARPHTARFGTDESLLVVIGNPPYTRTSATRTRWVEQLLKTDMDGAQSYYTVDGKPLREKNTKWLHDDYVAFLRLAQWDVQRAGRGVVAMITPHSYLDNPTFRGMRQSLLKTFDEIYILDLHGNSLKRETAPDGSPDENVFDIRQGVAIALMVKHGDPQQRGVYYAHLYGRREDKYAWLDSHDFFTASSSSVLPNHHPPSSPSTVL